MAELPGFDRFLTLSSVQMDRQSDDEADNLFLGHQLPEILRIGRFATASVVVVRAGNPLLAIGHRDANPHRAVINCSEPTECVLMSVIFMLPTHKYPVQPCSSSNLTMRRIDSSSRRLATSVASGVWTMIKSLTPTVATK